MAKLTVCNDFSNIYPELVNDLILDGEEQPSRNGHTIEIERNIVEIHKPTHRCVFGLGRDMNVFFLLAEAMWIVAGMKDVETLTTFNKRMSDYSDDGVNFNAAYGFRLRHCDVPSYINTKNATGTCGVDQIKENIKLLSSNPDTRRAVAQIWNTGFDLNKNSKDIPCNDLLMWKIRDGRLNCTISNRSNDIFWGLPTNLFQFSFLNEVMAQCLGFTVGSQTHFSDSLHAYTDIPLFSSYKQNIKQKKSAVPVYDIFHECDFSIGRLPGETPFEKLDKITKLIEHYFETLNTALRNGFNINLVDFMNTFECNMPDDVELNLHMSEIFQLTTIYASYSSTLRSVFSKNHHLDLVKKRIEDEPEVGIDYKILALNFFLKRLKGKDDRKITETKAWFYSLYVDSDKCGFDIDDIAGLGKLTEQLGDL